MALGPIEEFEGGVTEATWWLWHVFLRDAREWRDARVAKAAGSDPS
jgi:hypothetical protein